MRTTRLLYVLLAGSLACGDEPASAPIDCAVAGSCECDHRGEACAQEPEPSSEGPIESAAADPCAQDHGGCAPQADCRNEGGAAMCGACPDGYDGTGIGPDGCTDVDECMQGSHDCASPHVCQNTDGSHACVFCEEGTREQDGACVATWMRRIASKGDEHARGVAVDALGAVIVAGSTTGTLRKLEHAGLGDAFVVKYDAEGIQRYAVEFGTSRDEVVTDVVVDPQGNAYVVGSTEGRFAGNAAAGGTNLFIAKLDAAGELQWIRQFGSDADDSSAGASFGASALHVTGFTEGDLGGAGNAGDADAFIAKYSAAGDRLWLRQFGTADSDLGAAVAVDPEGNAFVSGESAGELEGTRNLGGADAFVVKYGPSGQLVWATQLGTVAQDGALGVAGVEAQNAYVVGVTGSGLEGGAGAGEDDGFVLKVDGSGTTHWLRQFGSERADVANAVAVDALGGAWVVGVARGGLNGGTGPGMFVLRYDSSGKQRWSHQHVEIGSASAADIALDAEGNAYVVGFSADAIDGVAVQGASDAFVVKLDATGERL